MPGKPKNPGERKAGNTISLQLKTWAALDAYIAKNKSPLMTINRNTVIEGVLTEFLKKEGIDL